MAQVNSRTRVPNTSQPRMAANNGERLETNNVFAVDVLVRANIKHVNIVAHRQPENRPGQPMDLIVVNKFFFWTKTMMIATVIAQKMLRQKVTSKLLAASKWRVKTPAMLQQKQQPTKVKIAFVFT
jgi:hypothetical protein